MHFPDNCLLHVMGPFPPTLQGFAVMLHKQEKRCGPSMREACKSPGADGRAIFGVPRRAELGAVVVVAGSSLCCFLSPSSFGGMPHLSLFCPLSLWQVVRCVISRQLSDPDLAACQGQGVGALPIMRLCHTLTFEEQIVTFTWVKPF